MAAPTNGPLKEKAATIRSPLVGPSVLIGGGGPYRRVPHWEWQHMSGAHLPTYWVEANGEFIGQHIGWKPMGSPLAPKWVDSPLRGRIGYHLGRRTPPAGFAYGMKALVSRPRVHKMNCNPFKENKNATTLSQLLRGVPTWPMDRICTVRGPLEQSPWE